MKTKRTNLFKPAFIALVVMIITSFNTCALFAGGGMDNLFGGGSSAPDPKTQEAPDPRIGRATRPPTPRPSGNTHTNSVGMRFTLVQPGTFKMGGADPAMLAKPELRALYEKEDLTEYETSITRPYYIGISTVTERQWAAVMGTPVTDIVGYNTAQPSDAKKGYAPGTRVGPDGPVSPVNWNEAQEFINKLNEKEGTNRYRLPTEAEWEHAVRGGADLQFPMIEWCNDFFDKNYFSRMPSADPWGPQGDLLARSGKVVRQGWSATVPGGVSDGFLVRIDAQRNFKPSPMNAVYHGFRVVLDTDHASEVPAPATRQINIDARRVPQYHETIAVGDFELWDLAPVFVKINGGPEKVVLAGGRSPIKRTFTAAIGDKVEVLWMGDARTGEVYVSYTDTPAASYTDHAKILVSTGRVVLHPSQAVPLVQGAFTVTERGTQNSITYASPAAAQVTTAPGTFTVELANTKPFVDGKTYWYSDDGAILISVNGGYPTTLVEQPPTSRSIPAPHKATFTARAGDRVQIIWYAPKSSNAHVFVYRNDRPAGSINDTANVLGALGEGSSVGRAQTPGGPNSHTGENVVVDLVVR